jgi:hypothetical protein
MAVNWTVRMLKVGQSEVRGPEIFFMSDWEKFYPLWFTVTLLQRDDQTILINTGPPADLGEMNRSWVEYIGDPRGALVVQESERLERALPAIGVDPARVQAVILTPLQQYTLGGIRLFPSARICISRHGWREFHAPRFPVSHAARRGAIPDDILTHLCTEAWDRVCLLDDTDEVAPGITTFRTGVHHPESLAVRVQTAKGSVVLTDSLFYYENLEQQRILGIAENHEEFHEACHRIRREADLVIPLYDPRVFDRHPGGVVA